MSERNCEEAEVRFPFPLLSLWLTQHKSMMIIMTLWLKQHKRMMMLMTKYNHPVVGAKVSEEKGISKMKSRGPKSVSKKLCVPRQGKLSGFISIDDGPFS